MILTLESSALKILWLARSRGSPLVTGKYSCREIPMEKSSLTDQRCLAAFAKFGETDPSKIYHRRNIYEKGPSEEN